MWSGPARVGFFADQPHLVAFQEKCADHARRRGIGGGLHGFAPALHHFQAIFKTHRPGKRKSRVFAQAQPRHHLAGEHGIGRFRPQHFQGGQARHENRRLADDRGVQFLRRPKKAELGQIVAQNLRRLVIKLAGRGIFLGNVLPHAHVLSTLAGEEERNFTHRQLLFVS